MQQGDSDLALAKFIQIFDKHERTRAAPIVRGRSYLTPSDRIASNYTPSARTLTLEAFKQRADASTYAPSPRSNTPRIAASPRGLKQRPLSPLQTQRSWNPMLTARAELTQTQSLSSTWHPPSPPPHEDVPVDRFTIENTDLRHVFGRVFLCI